MTVKRLFAWPILMLALSAPFFVDCSSSSGSNSLDVNCDELKAGASISSLGDAKLTAFVQATADLEQVTNDLQTEVLTSCSKIATDLGVMDTWSAKTTNDDKVQEACTQAKTAIEGIVNQAAMAQASITLTYVPPECTVDASGVAMCEATCSGMASCDPGDLNVSCDPGQLAGTCSAMCSGSCTAQANATVDCQGSCSGNCTGTCSGKCTGTCMGTCSAMDAMGNCIGTCMGTCTGKCDASCTGKCDASCKMDANASVMCSGECKGGCSVAYTAPKCYGDVKPPSCSGNADCTGSCNAHFQATAMCTPPTVSVDATATSSVPNYDKLVATLKANAGGLVDAVVGKGRLAVSAAAKVGTTGAAAAQTFASAGVHGLACATASAAAAVKASASVSASVSVSASATASVGGPSMSNM